MSRRAPDIATPRDQIVALIPNLRAFARSLARNPDRADDLVQEALIRAFDHVEQFQEGTNLKAWMFTILRNVYFSQLRKTRNEVEDADGTYAGNVGVEGGQSSHMDMLDFGAAFAKLPAEQREALLLVGAEGFAYEEAALMCGCAVGTIKSRVNRARARLAEDLGLHDPATTADQQ